MEARVVQGLIAGNTWILVTQPRTTTQEESYDSPSILIRWVEVIWGLGVWDQQNHPVKMILAIMLP